VVPVPGPIYSDKGSIIEKGYFLYPLINHNLDGLVLLVTKEKANDVGEEKGGFDEIWRCLMIFW